MLSEGVYVSQTVASRFPPKLLLLFLILLGLLLNAQTADAQAYYQIINGGTVPLCSTATIQANGFAYNNPYAPQTSIATATISGSSDFSLPPVGSITDDCNGIYQDITYVGQCHFYFNFHPTQLGPQTAVLNETASADFPNNPQINYTVTYLVQVNVVSTGLDSTSCTPPPPPPPPPPLPPPLPPLIPPVDSTHSCGISAHSSVNVDSLSLSESVAIVGVPFSLSYSSDLFRPNAFLEMRAFGLGGWVPDIIHFYDAKNKLMYDGAGGIRNITPVAISSGFYATDEAGSEVYDFNSNGMHLQTRDALTGATKYSFSYNQNGSLASIADGFGNATIFTASSSGVLITSPYGQLTSLTFDLNGFLASVTNPNNETYLLTNTANGYPISFQKPGGQKSVVS